MSLDPDHCGGCGMACVLPNAVAACANSSCAVGSCNAGFGDCDAMAANGCEVDTKSDRNHCGGCGTVCTSNQVCSGAICKACAKGFLDCNGSSSDGCEVHATADEQNCGGCGIACGWGQSCWASTCNACAGLVFTFAAKTDFGTGDGPNSAAVADVNGDGKLDLVTANVFGDDVSVLLNASVCP